MTTTTNVTNAQAMIDAFTEGPRKSTDTGRMIYVLTDGSPEWMSDVIHHAHGDMLPDDFRYELVREALEAIVEAEGDDDEARERLPEVPIYNHERLMWLASHGNRPCYCDDAIDEFGLDTGGILDVVAMGYRAEQKEVLGLVIAGLEKFGPDAEN